jgi:hypothetical protein
MAYWTSLCGSSVFPTAGHANPTQMIVALAVRVADTLKSRYCVAEIENPMILGGAHPGHTMRTNANAGTVTGGAGKIGRHVVNELLARVI